MKTLNKQQGFTLVELIIVIVILGILAVTAAPKFLNFSGDAKVSVLESMIASVKAVNGAVKGKATIAGVQTAALSCFNTATGAVSAASQTLIDADAAETAATAGLKCANADIVFGSIDADEESIAALLETGDFYIADSATYQVNTSLFQVAIDANTVRIALSESEAKALATDACWITYTAATSSTAAATAVLTGACQ